MKKVLLPLKLRRLNNCLLLSCFMSVMVAINYKSEKIVDIPERSSETDPIEIVETEPIHILTDTELSNLYSYKEQIKNEKCLELSVDDALLLMQVARAEGGESKTGQLWVMCAIMNRIESDLFPNTVYGVVSQDNPIQFEVFKSGKYKTADINSNTHMALAELEMGFNPTQGAVWFEANSNSSKSWHKSKEFVAEVDGNLYYR